MAEGELVSVKEKLVVVELIVRGSVIHTITGSKFVVHSTWNKSFVDAVHCNVTFVDVTVAL